MPHLFDPFFSSKDDGTGLGLSVALQLVEGHGGAIEIAAREGGGTVARVSLPQDEGEAP
jgi:signal transduction histidine kinase